MAAAHCRLHAENYLGGHVGRRVELELGRCSERVCRKVFGGALSRSSESAGCRSRAEMMAKAACFSSYRDGLMVPVCEPVGIFEAFRWDAGIATEERRVHGLMIKCDRPRGYRPRPSSHMSEQSFIPQGTWPYWAEGATPHGTLHTLAWALP